MRTRWILLTLVVLALVLRLEAMVLLHSWRHPEAMEHQAISKFLVEGRGFAFSDFGSLGPTGVQSPTYPFLLAGIFELFGVQTVASYFVAICVNILISAACVPLVYAMARILGARTGIAIFASAIYAVWPSQIYAPLQAQAIAIIIAGVMGMIVLFYYSMRRGTWRSWLGYSVVATFAALTEPVLLPVAALSGLVILCWRTMPLRIRIRNASILLAAAVVVLGPWTIRNRLVLGRWSPVKNTFWVNFWKGANDYATGTDRLKLNSEQQKTLWQSFASLSDSNQRKEADNIDFHQRAMLTAAQYTQLEYKTETQREGIFKQWSLSWLKTHPARYVQLCFIRLGKTLWIDWDNPKSYNFFYVIPRTFLVLVSVVGLFFAMKHSWSLLFPLLLWGTCLLTYSLTLTAARFSLPFEPFQMCLAAPVIIYLWRLVSARTTKTEDRPSNLVWQ